MHPSVWFSISDRVMNDEVLLADKAGLAAAGRSSKYSTARVRPRGRNFRHQSADLAEQQGRDEFAHGIVVATFVR